MGRRRKRTRKWRKIIGEGKYLFCGGEEKWKRIIRKIFEEGKYLFPRKRKRRKIFGERKKIEGENNGKGKGRI